MDRRAFLCASAALGLGPTGALAAASDPYGPIFREMLRRSPEAATSAGFDKGAGAALKHRLDDRSAAARFNYYQAITAAAPRLRAQPARGPRDAIFRGTVLWLAEALKPFHSFQYGGVDANFYPIPYVVTQGSAAYYAVPDFLQTQHSVETRDDALAYLDRLQAFAAAIDQETARMKADAGRGVTPPHIIVERALSQLKAFQAEQQGAAAPLVTSLSRRAAARGIAGDWGPRAQALVDGPIAAAAARQVAALEALLPIARTAVGAGSLPHGDAFYAACLHFHTTTRVTPDEAHRLGIAQVAELQAQVKPILEKQGYGSVSLGQAFKAMASDPRYLFPNDEAGRAALLDYIRGLETAMYDRLPKAFARRQKTPLEVRRVPQSNELGAPGAYAMSGSIDGTRPGAIYFNLRDTGNWPRWAIATTAYHEGLPGHHFQGSIANETPDLPELFKVLNFSAYTEGWALYAEQLSGEIGAYEDNPLGRLGMLRDSLFRACRLVVDTGMHAKGWTREQSIAFLMDNAGSTPDDARRETERYISWPGQACAYKIGQLEILKLRSKAQARLGARFDLKAFHTTVLQYGSLPLEVLDKAVDQWVRDAGGAPRPGKA